MIFSRLKQVYHQSPGAASALVVLVLVFFFQCARLHVGHTDNNAIRLLKIGTALVFVVWSISYLKKQKNS